MAIEPLNTIGILGGMSAAATGEYYQLINQKVKEIRGGHNIAELIICSVNFGNIERFVRAGEWEEAGSVPGRQSQKRGKTLAQPACF